MTQIASWEAAGVTSQPRACLTHELHDIELLREAPRTLRCCAYIACAWYQLLVSVTQCTCPQCTTANSHALKTRRNCQWCRYQRCLAVGMKPSWVLSSDERERRFRKNRDKKEKKEASTAQSAGVSPPPQSPGHAVVLPSLPHHLVTVKADLFPVSTAASSISSKATTSLFVGNLVVDRAPQAHIHRARELHRQAREARDLQRPLPVRSRHTLVLRFGARI